MKLNKKFFRTRTFWDADFDKLDVIKDKEFMVSRVVERGSELEILHVHSVLTYLEIYNILKNFMGTPEKILIYYKAMADASS